ncbi:hypothetical protein BGX28_002532 [Mortierella sp. GBA30]|nr:hypothetical protein BGX28_002532 [Mortierella sp. GBA30]
MTSTTMRDIGRAARKPRFIAALILVALLASIIFRRDTVYGTVGSKYDGGDFERLKGNPFRFAVSKSQTVVDRLLRSEKLYMENLDNRNTFLKDHGYGTAQWSPWGPANKEMMPWWWYFQPAFNCPHELQRVGRFNDGGKWVCGLSLMSKARTKKCIIYSMGVFDDSSFEAELLRVTNCEVFAFDGSVDGIIGGCIFKKVFIGAEDKVDESGNTWKSLRTIMKEYGHQWIDLLKVDIEGHEYVTMDALMASYDVLPFSQLQIEFHLDGVTFDDFKNWFERLEKHHLRPFMSEVNLVATVLSGAVQWYEYSFINIGGDHALLHD